MNRVERPITQRREHTVSPEGEAVELLLKNGWIHTTKKVLDRWKKEGTVFSGID